jgi:hypothetical protein
VKPGAQLLLGHSVLPGVEPGSLYSFHDHRQHKMITGRSKIYETAFASPWRDGRLSRAFPMSLEQTQQMIDHYFDVMTRGGDFAVY